MSKMLYMAASVAAAASIAGTPETIHGVEVITMTVKPNPDDKGGKKLKALMDEHYGAGWHDSPAEADEAAGDSDDDGDDDKKSEAETKADELIAEQKARITDLEGEAKQAAKDHKAEIAALKKAHKVEMDKESKDHKAALDSAAKDLDAMTAERDGFKEKADAAIVTSE